MKIMGRHKRCQWSLWGEAERKSIAYISRTFVSVSVMRHVIPRLLYDFAGAETCYHSPIFLFLNITNRNPG